MVQEEEEDALYHIAFLGHLKGANSDGYTLPCFR